MDDTVDYLNPNAFLHFPIKELEESPKWDLNPPVLSTSTNTSNSSPYSATLSPVESNLIFCDHVTLDSFEPSESLLFDLYTLLIVALPSHRSHCCFRMK